MAALVCGKMELSHLCLSSLALMVWHADFVKDTVQLVNAAVDLLGEVAGVHGEQNQPPRGDSSVAKGILAVKGLECPKLRWCSKSSKGFWRR